MTVKQLLIGTLVGSSIVGLMALRLHNAKGIPARFRSDPAPKLARQDKPPTKITFSKHRKSPWLKKKHDNSSGSELTSRKLYG